MTVARSSRRNRRVYGCPKTIAAVQKARIAAGFQVARQTGSRAPARKDRDY